MLPSAVDLGVNVRIRSRAVAVELHCARNSYHRLTVQLLADRFDVGRGAILKAAKTERWRNVEHLLRASRTLHVAVELERSSRGADAIAQSLHFGTPSAVHHHVKRETGLTIRQLKFEGALKIAAELWRRRGLD